MWSFHGYILDRVMVRPSALSFLFGLLLMATGTRIGHLSRNVIPKNYNLEIVTHLDDDKNLMFVFEGKVNIKVKCLNSTDTIFLNVFDLTIHQGVTFNNIGGDQYSVYVVEWCLYPENETMSIKLNKPLTPGSTYNLKIRFTGNLSYYYRGYYRDYYYNSTGKKRKWMAFTNFQPTDARRAFPCFDEPNFKATFEISLGRLRKYNTLSNMPLERTEPMKDREGWVWDRFQKSVRMSTYLVAFVVSEYKPLVAPKAPTNNVILKIWHSDHENNLTSLAANTASKGLEFFEQYLNIKYVLPKLDMVSVNRFPAGAMENWGLIIILHHYLLYDPNSLSHSKETAITSVIFHELAHQWFGNLVTIKWWSDIWLNEGFATFMAALAVHHLYPEWDSLNEERINDVSAIFSIDCINSSRPVSSPVRTPQEILDNFDRLVYQKGSCLVNMMFHFLGEETFKKGITKYLKKKKFKNVEQDDLFQFLTNEGHISGTLARKFNVKTIMDTWTLQAGYPVITVNRSYEDNSTKITQERFYQDKSISPTNECWWIPLTYTNQRKKRFGKTRTRRKDWLSCPPNTKIIKNIATKNEWVIFNIRMVGLYRVNYDDRNWEMLQSTLNSESYNDIPVLNRFLLIDDSESMAALGKISYKIFFGILRYLDRETDYLLWEEVWKITTRFEIVLRNTTALEVYREFMKGLLEPIAEKIKAITVEGQEPGDFKKLKLKEVVLKLACHFKASACVPDVGQMFREHVKSPRVKTIAQELRSVVYCNGMKNAGDNEWNFLWSKYKQTDAINEKDEILESLGCSENPSLLQRYLQVIVDERSGLRKGDSSKVFNAVARNEMGYQIAKSFFQTNVQKIFESSKFNVKEFSAFLFIISESVTTEEEYEEFKLFIYQHNKIFSKLRTDVNRALEKAKYHIQWRKLHLHRIEQYLKQP